MIKLDNLPLPENLVWLDEYSWISRGGQFKRTLGGGLVLYTSRIHGRPITLGKDWIKRDALMSVVALAEQGGTHTLLLHDRTFRVVFRYDDQPVVEVRPIIEMTNPPDTAWYEVVAIKLMEI